MRYINLRRPPFGLGKPGIRIWDFIAPAPPGYLKLWSRDDIKGSHISLRVRLLPNRQVRGMLPIIAVPTIVTGGALR